jgi:maleamate amidohydrolase
MRRRVAAPCSRGRRNGPIGTALACLFALHAEGIAMTDGFEDHCWRDAVPAEVLEIYRHYARDIFIGPKPALLAIDLYEMAYQGGALPVADVAKLYPSSCGINAWRAIEPTRQLFAGAIRATKRRNPDPPPGLFAIRPEFKPEPGDVVITKQRASAFFGTPLIAHLTQLGIQTLIVVGESTSGCVRASAVDGYSYGFHVVLVEECCFDRSEISHKINLFDMHHKYADVMSVADALAHLATLRLKEAV